MAETAAKGVVHSVASKQGTQREYESVTILRPATSKPEIQTLIERMQGMFTDFGARLIKIDSWGTRILAFPVRRERKGIYLYWRYLGGSDIVAEFERLMGLSDKVIRFYTVKIDDDVDPEARPSEVTEELLEAAHHQARLYKRAGSNISVEEAGMLHHDDAMIQSVADRIGYRIDWTKIDD